MTLLGRKWHKRDRIKGEEVKAGFPVAACCSGKETHSRELSSQGVRGKLDLRRLQC